MCINLFYVTPKHKGLIGLVALSFFGTFNTWVRSLKLSKMAFIELCIFSDCDL